MKTLKRKEVFKNAQKGDKVWNSIYGWGIVIDIGTNKNYPIKCKFENYTESYMYNGISYACHINPTLFWAEHELYPVTTRPEPEINWNRVPVDTEVLARDNKEDSWQLMNFCIYLQNKNNYKFYTFSDGERKKKAVGIIYWNYCKLADGVEIKKEWLK